MNFAEFQIHREAVLRERPNVRDCAATNLYAALARHIPPRKADPPVKVHRCHLASEWTALFGFAPEVSKRALISCGARDSLRLLFQHYAAEGAVVLLPADNYPVYGELRAIFDLSLALALVDADGLMERANWTPTRLLDDEQLRLPHWPAPKEVDTVANSVVVGRRQIIAGVSGGVMVDAKQALAMRTKTDSPVLANVRGTARAVPASGEAIRWWWDSED